MMGKTELLKVDGLPMVPPDADMNVSFEDLDSSDSGRDEAGVMHRLVIRHGVGKWEFSYSNISPADYAYTESLFAEKAQFRFTFPDFLTGQERTVTAYRSSHGVSWQNIATGMIRNYKFNITEC